KSTDGHPMTHGPPTFQNSFTQVERFHFDGLIGRRPDATSTSVQPRGCDPRCARFRPGRAASCARALSMRLQAFGEPALGPAAVAAISDDCGPATSRRASTQWMRSKVQVVLDQRMLYRFYIRVSWRYRGRR